ncbi:hypothetical protein ACWENO_14685 [Streptomyces sp. NPDC004436]
MNQPPIHVREDDSEPRLDGYVYNAGGVGVRRDLIDAVLAAWTSISMVGDPAVALRSVDSATIFEVDNLARAAAHAVAEQIAARP